MRLSPFLAAFVLCASACGGGSSGADPTPATDASPPPTDSTPSTRAPVDTEPPATDAPTPTTDVPAETEPPATDAPPATEVPPATDAPPATEAPEPMGETDELGREIGTFPATEAEIDDGTYDQPERALAYVSTLTGNCRDYVSYRDDQISMGASFLSALLDYETEEVVDLADCTGGGEYTYTALQFADGATALRSGQSLDASSFNEGVCANGVVVDETLILMAGTSTVDVAATADDLVDWIGRGEVASRCAIESRDAAPPIGADPAKGGEVYPDQLRDNFIGACTEGGGDLETCGCTIDEIAQRLTLSEYIDAELAMQAGEALPDAITESFALCLGGG